jgi:hypothetical protein
MAERPVGLDLRMPAGQSQGDRAGSTPGGTARQQPDQEAAARFAQSLRGSEGGSVPPHASGSQAASPFSLFSRAAPGSDSAPATPLPRQTMVAKVWDTGAFLELLAGAALDARSEERRVGKECS